MVTEAERQCRLGGLDARSLDIIYFVAEREIGGYRTTVSHIILNDRFGSLGTAQRHLYALVADRWLEARPAEEDARRKYILLGPVSREAFQSMSEMLKERLAAEKGFAAPEQQILAR